MRTYLDLYELQRFMIVVISPLTPGACLGSFTLLIAVDLQPDAQIEKMDSDFKHSTLSNVRLVFLHCTPWHHPRPPFSPVAMVGKLKRHAPGVQACSTMAATSVKSPLRASRAYILHLRFNMDLGFGCSCMLFWDLY